MVILGKNIILYLQNDLGSYVRIGAGRSVEFNTSRELKETTNQQSGVSRSWINGMLEETLNVSGLQGYSNGSLYDATGLYTKLTASGTTPLNFQFTVDNGTYKFTYSGQCLIKTLRRARVYNDVSTYDAEFQVSGPVTVTQTGTYIPYYWLISNTQLTAAQVQNLIQTGSANTVNGPSYATISINFGAIAQQWLYFAIPSVSPDRLSYYVSVGDNGRVGQPGDLFTYTTLPITIGSNTNNYKIYSSNVAKINNSPMELRTYYPTGGAQVIGYGTTVYQKYTATGSEGNSITIPALAGVQLNKLILIMRGGIPATGIIAAPTVPTGQDISFDTSSGKFTVDASVPFVPGEQLTIIYLS